MRKDLACLYCSVQFSISHSGHPPDVLISSLFGSLASQTGIRPQVVTGEKHC